MTASFLRLKIYRNEPDRPEVRRYFDVVEVPFEDFEQFVMAVAADRIICGYLVWAPQLRGEAHVFKVLSRKPVVFRGRVVAWAEVFHGEFIEEAG